MLAAIAGIVGGTMAAAGPVTEAVLELDRIRKWDESNGDTWDPFWADDGRLYSFNCDGRGFGTQGRNLAFHRLDGENAAGLAGSLVNSMDAYGVGNAKRDDGATWKALGQECIDGVFYCFVSRHTYGHESHDRLMRQTAVNASLIASRDRGKTWERAEEENYRNPMWPGSRFGGPFFVHFGQDGGKVARDGADRYVYATSPNGFWNCGDDYVLGRVERAKLPRLDAADWEYWTGGDGMAAGSWARQLGKSKPVLALPAQCGTGPVTYVPALETYVLIAWHLPVTLTKWFDPDEVRYDFYQAPHPWGPWSLVSSCSDRFLAVGHMYGPSICARFQERTADGVRVAMFTSGCQFEDVPGSLYKMWMIPVLLRTTPPPAATLVNDDDPRIGYRGKWTAAKNRGFHDLGDDVHFTTSPGDAAEFAFTGTGIEVLAEKNADHGKIEVSVDGARPATVDLSLVNFPRISRVTVFSVRDLAPGRHTIRVIHRGPGYGVLDGFRILGG